MNDANTSNSLNALFEPRAIAVIGASKTVGKLGSTMMQSLSSFPGAVVPVNPRGDGPRTVQEAKDAHPDVDLAVLCIPAVATAAAIEECAAAGIHAAVVCSGGFGEAGVIGASYQKEVEQAVRRTRVRLLGPNTSGFFVPERSLLASFVPGVAELTAGKVGVVAASGGVNHAVSFQLDTSGAGVSIGVGIGGGLDITAPEVLDYLADHEGTSAVALHLETVPDGPRLLESVRRLARSKPVAAFVVGRGDVGDFARSHTGALATSWDTTRALLAQAGAVIVDSETELVNASSALSTRRLEPQPNPGVALVTGQAGPGLIVNDELLHHCVNVPRLQSETVERLSGLLPPLTFLSNPVDTGRPGREYPEILRTVADDPGIDAIGIYGITEPVVSLPEAVQESGISDETSVLIAVDGPEREVAAVRSCSASDIPVLRGPSALAQGLSALRTDAALRYRTSAAAVEALPAPRPALEPLGSGPWNEAEAKDVLNSAGIDTPRRKVIPRLPASLDCHSLLAEFDSPAAVKLLDSEVLHKTEMGGVHLGIATGDDLTTALTELHQIGAPAALVEEMASEGIDLLLGVRYDPVFGIVALISLGGVEAEIYDDTAIVGLPAPLAQIESIVDQLTASRLLDGFRGSPVLDRNALAHVIAGLGRVLEQNPQIEEIEINPLRITQEGLIALDAVIIPRESSTVSPHQSIPLTVEEEVS